jgi:outer membrane protein TolC
MTVSILYPEHQYIFNNVQMGLIYDLLLTYMDQAEAPDELSLTQETLDAIYAQSFGES